MGFDLTEKRYVKQTGLEARLAAIIEPVANDLGYALVRVKITQENGMTLQIMAEDADGRFTIADCERLTHRLGLLLDVEDPIDSAYVLEVSTPGLDRPLRNEQDCRRFQGRLARIKTHSPLDGRKRFLGRLGPVESGAVRIEDEEIGDVSVPLASIESARLEVEFGRPSRNTRKRA